MGHDLITIYWIKALEYVLAVSYLPLFFLFWYGLAIALATLAGRLLGRRMLRW